MKRLLFSVVAIAMFSVGANGAMIEGHYFYSTEKVLRTPVTGELNFTIFKDASDQFEKGTYSLSNNKWAFGLPDTGDIKINEAVFDTGNWEVNSFRGDPFNAIFFDLDNNKGGVTFELNLPFVGKKEVKLNVVSLKGTQKVTHSSVPDGGNSILLLGVGLLLLVGGLKLRDLIARPHLT